MSSREPRFSSRFDWELQPNQLSRLLLEKREASIEILDLTESNPTQAGVSYPSEAILDSLGDPASMVYEPASAGLDRTRSAVAAYYASRGLNVEAEQILLTASTSEAYGYLFKLLTDPGDEVVAPRPSYPLFEFLTRMDGVSLRHYSLRYEKGWWLDTASLESAITERTRAVLAVNPNNPTGSYLTKSEIDSLLEICRRRNLALIVDEVFSDYAIGARTPRYTRRREQ